MDFLPSSFRRRRAKRLAQHGRYSRALRAASRFGGDFFARILGDCLDHASEARNFASLKVLERYPAKVPAFEKELFLALGDSGASTIERLRTLAASSEHGPFERMCFRAWIAFLQSERLDIPAMSAASCSEVVQFWAQNEAPEDIRANIKAWSACFGSRHKVFDALTAEAFLKAEFGASHAEVFRSAGHPVIQADLFRLGYLASRGGVYVDADTRPRVGSVQIIDAMTDLDVLTYETSRPKLHIQNAFISAAKGSDFALRCYLEGVCRVRDGSRPVQALAGGYMMTDVLTFNDEPPTQLAISGWFLRNRLIADRSRSYQGGDLDWRVWDANRLK